MSTTTLLLLVASGLLASLLIAFGLGAFQDFVDEIQATATWISGGGVVLTLWAVALWKSAPDFVKQLIAKLIRLAPDVPNRLKRRAIKNEIESSLNRAFKQFNREGAGFVDHEIRISWLNPGDDAREVFFRSDRAYLKLDYSRSVETNIVEAALIFCGRGLLLETRQYVSRPLMKAIDLQFVNEVLQRHRAAVSRAYFVHEVIQRETDGNEETQRFLRSSKSLVNMGCLPVYCCLS